MSIVTNIIFSFSNIEHGGDDTGDFILMQKVNEWLLKNSYSGDSFGKSINAYAGGYRALECRVYAAAFNHFSLDEFIEFVKSLDWICPESVQIIVQGQEDIKFRIIEICDREY